MSEKIKLSETVVLIDAAFLSFVVTDLKGYFEQVLKRPLLDLDLSDLTVYMALDAGIIEGPNEVQLLLVYDNESSVLQHCSPSNLKEELNGVAFSCQYGEFSFASVPCEELVSREELFLDLLHIVSDADDVKKLIVISYNEEYGPKVSEALKQVAGKEIIQFRMDEPEEAISYRWEMLAYPLMRALGVRGDEL